MTNDPSDAECDAIIDAHGWAQETMYRNNLRRLIRAAYAAGAASVAVPREPRKCQECGAYEHSPAYCATCGFAWKDAAPARQDQSGEVEPLSRAEGEASPPDEAVGARSTSPDPTPAPVDKTANPQGSPVDKSPKSQGEPRDDASYATEYADPTPAAEPVIAPSKLVAAIKVQLSAAQVALLSGNKERCYGPLVWLNIYGREAVKRIEDLEEQLRDALRDADILADMAQPDPTPASDDLVAKLLTPIQCKTFANNGWQCLTIDQALSIGKQRKQAAARIVEQDKRIDRLYVSLKLMCEKAERAESRLVEADKRIARWKESHDDVCNRLDVEQDRAERAESRVAELERDIAAIGPDNDVLRQRAERAESRLAEAATVIAGLVEDFNTMPPPKPDDYNDIAGWTAWGDTLYANEQRTKNAWQAARAFLEGEK